MIGYCTNVHKCDSFNDVLKIVENPARIVRKRLGREQLAAGLFLPAQAARWLAGKPKARAKLIAAMHENGIVSTTANAFPYTAFHADVVKEKVYQPSWTDVRRREHTLRVARVMHHLAPPGVQASISTVPLGWGDEFTGIANREEAARELALFAWQVREEAPPLDDGRPRIRLGLEPEPCTALTTLAQTIEFFRDVLWDIGEDVISSEMGIPRADARHILRSTIGVCLDACHAAVVFERAADNLAKFHEAGIPVVKVQLSSAPEVTAADAETVLAPFAEPKYLHQTFAVRRAGPPLAFRDLPEALAGVTAGLANGTLDQSSKVRSHFHLPLHFTGHDRLGTTQPELRDLIAALARARRDGWFDGDIETETYTWGVMPKGMAPHSLPDGIADEIRWAEAAMAEA